MKRIIPILICALMLLCGCSSQTEQPQVSKKSGKAENTVSGTFESSIFRKDITYDRFTPAEDIVLPVNSSDILEFIQVESTAYVLGDGGVFKLNLNSGESEKLFDTSAELMDVNNGVIYTYSNGDNTLESHSSSGEALGELVIEENIYHLYVTDDYYIVIAGIKNANKNRLSVYSKESGEITSSRDISLYYFCGCAYKDNSIFLVEESLMGHYNLSSFDAQSGKLTKVTEVNAFYGISTLDICYDQKSDTVIAYYGNDINNKTSGIVEIALDNSDYVLLQRFYYDNIIGADTRLFLNVYENVISTVCTLENKYSVYDRLDPPEYITIAGRSEEVGYAFEQKYGIQIREVSLDSDRLNLKLMAGDNDIDLFYGNFDNYAKAGLYEDLKQYPGLNSRISNNTAVEYYSSYNDTYTCVPEGLRNYYTKEYYPEDAAGSINYSKFITFALYRALHIDVTEGAYTDPNGSEFYKVLKFVSKYPNGNEKAMPFGKEIPVLDGAELMLNPGSLKKEYAVKYLELMFDAYNGDIPGIIPESDLYPQITSTKGWYINRKFTDMTVVSPLYDAYNSAVNGDIDDATLKKMAREAAAEVAMRIGE